MFKIAIIGCGIVAEGHLAAIAASADWELAAIVEINDERRTEIEERFGPRRSFPDYRALLAEVQAKTIELDAVIVATHVETHHEITIAALRAGLHVLCEKPMADTVEKCREMCDEAARQGRMLAVNFNTRSSEPYLTLKRIIDSGGIGKIRVVRFVYDWSAHQWTPKQRVETFMKNGGPVIDSAVHFYEGVRWYTGQEFVRIDACGAIIEPYEHPQHVISSCQLTDGAIALVEAGWLYTKRTKDRGMLYNITVIGDDGTADFNANNDRIRVWTQTETREIQSEDHDKHFDRVHAHFADSVRQGELVWLASGEDGLRATEAAYKALASAHRPSDESSYAAAPTA